MALERMKSIAFFNNKGGVGKTTLLCNVAAILGLKMAKQVLVIDADPQCNATQVAKPTKQVGNRVFVIHGRNEQVRTGLFDLLRASLIYSGSCDILFA